MGMARVDARGVLPLGHGAIARDHDGAVGPADAPVMSVLQAGSRFGARPVGLASRHLLPARANQVDQVLEAARMQMAAEADQGAAPEVVHRAQRLAGLRELEVRTSPVARLALADELVAVGVEVRALLLGPLAPPVAPVSALDVEHRV